MPIESVRLPNVVMPRVATLGEDRGIEIARRTLNRVAEHRGVDAAAQQRLAKPKVA